LLLLNQYINICPLYSVTYIPHESLNRAVLAENRSINLHFAHQKINFRIYNGIVNYLPNLLILLQIKKLDIAL